MELEIFINSQEQSTSSLKNMMDYSNKMLNNRLKIKIYDVSKSKDKKIAEKYGYMLKGHRLELYGVRRVKG